MSELAAKPSGFGARALVALVRGYQRWISPILPPSCRFYPSCSEYAVDSIATHGAWRGTGYAALRLLKCGPWHRGGYDPVKPRRGNATGVAGRTSTTDLAH